MTLVRKSFNLRGNDCKTSLPDQNDKRILWTTDFLNFYNPTVQPRYFCSKYCRNVTDFLTTGISVASCERSFSKLKLIKNYLRSTMSDARLTNLAILSIEREWQMKLILLM